MRVEWSAAAVADLRAISEFIERDRDLITANRVARVIYNSVRSLRASPHRGRYGRLPNTRELVIPRLPYIAIYSVSQDRIFVLGVIHGAQEWP